MAATKYDAMIAALDMIQNITDKPDWMLREEELALREKMHNDEMEMSLMMTQIKTGITDVDNLQDEINQYETELVDIKARILGTGKQKLDEIKLPENKTASGQAAPEELYKDIDSKYRNQLITLERNKRTATERLNKLKYRYKQRGEEFGTATGAQVVVDQEAKKEAIGREKLRLKIQQESAGEISKQRLATELRTKATFAGTSPTDLTSQMDAIYATLKTQVGEDGLFTPDIMLDYAEQLGGDYAENADQIALKLTELLTSMPDAGSFLNALGEEDNMYRDFLMETGVYSQPSMYQLNLLDMSSEIDDGTLQPAIDPMIEIQNLIKGLPPLVRRNK